LDLTFRRDEKSGALLNGFFVFEVQLDVKKIASLKSSSSIGMTENKEKTLYDFDRLGVRPIILEFTV